jgi:hypothetical protein
MIRLFTFLILGMAIVDLASSNGGSTGGEAPMPPHEQPPTSPWIRPPTSVAAGFPQRCRPWVRDGYQSIQVNVDARGCNLLGDAANEPSIAIDPTNPRKIVIGWRQFDWVTSNFRQAGHAYSHDGGHIWVFPGSLTPGVFGSDPVLAANAEGTIYYLSINMEEMRLFRSFDGGISWPERIQVAPVFYDKPWLAIDRTPGIGRNNIYICGRCRSLDRGQTFTSIQGGAGCFGGTVSVGGDGTLYVVDGPSLQCGFRFSRSLNAADPASAPIFDYTTLVWLDGTCGFAGIPNRGGLIGQNWIDLDRSNGPFSGRLYVLSLATTDVDGIYEDRADLVLRSSDDKGVTWNPQVKINDDPLDPGSWQWFNTLSVAPNGRVDVVWNDTRHSLQPRLSELFYSYSTDGGVTWSPNVPVSPVFDSWVGGPEDNPKLGDYYHMLSDNLGVNVAYAATFNGEQDVYFLRIGPWDCNGNEIDDADDIASGASLDCNANDVPDDCEYRADFDGDGPTTLLDYTAFASKMTGPGQSTNSGCDALLDIDHDEDIDLADYYGFQRVFAAP